MLIGPKPRRAPAWLPRKPASVPGPSQAELVAGLGVGVAEDGLSGALALERSQLFGEARELVVVEGWAVAEVGVPDLGVLDDRLAGQRVAVAAGVEVRELVVLDGQPELEVVRAEGALDHAGTVAARGPCGARAATRARSCTLACRACGALQPAAQSACVSWWESLPTSTASWRRSSHANW